MAGSRKVGDVGGKISEEVVGGDRIFGIPKVNERLDARFNTLSDYAVAYKGLADLIAASAKSDHELDYQYGVPSRFFSQIRALSRVTDDPIIQEALQEPNKIFQYWEYLPNYRVHNKDIIMIALEVLHELPDDLQKAWIKNAQRHYVNLRGNGKVNQRFDILMHLDQQYWTDVMWADALYLLDFGYLHSQPNNVAIVAARINPERWFEGPIQALRSAERVGAQLFFAMANMVTHGKPTEENIGWYFTDPAGKSAKEAKFVAMIDLVLPLMKVDLRLFFELNPDVAIQAQEAFYFNPDKVTVSNIIYFLTLLECIPQSLWTAQTKALLPFYLEPEHNDQRVRDAAIRLLLEIDLPE